MNIKIRKQFSKAYQVYEIELDGVPQEKIEGANAWMDRIGIAEVNKMADAVQPDSTEFVLTNIDELPTPNYTPKTNNVQSNDTPATPKQIEWLNKKNIQYDVTTITKKEASQLLDSVFKNDYTQPNKKNDNLPF